MKNLLIVGARGWGREVFQAIRKTQEVQDGIITIKGFLDSKSDALEGLRGCFPPIICSPEEYIVQPNDVFFVAMGDPQWRAYYAQLMEEKGGHFYTYISPMSQVQETAIIGEGSFISQWCFVSDNVTIGKHVVIHTFASLGHDSKVKDYGTLLTSAFLGGGAEVGVGSQMSPKSMIIPHKRIGDRVIVGAGSVVMRNFGDDISVFGNPAKKLDY